VDRAVPWRTTEAPATALARDAEAPEKVVAEPTVGAAWYCSVDAVESLVVTHSETNEVIAIGPVAVKITVPFTIVAVADKAMDGPTVEAEEETATAEPPLKDTPAAASKPCTPQVDPVIVSTTSFERFVVPLT